MAGDFSSGTFIPKWGVSPSDVFDHFSTSGVSVAAATGINHPLDVLKVRLQMQLVGQRGPSIGMGKLCMRASSKKNEGLKSLYLGLIPSLISLHLGLYEPSKYVCQLAFESTNVLMKIASGAFSGAVATALTNPVEVLKAADEFETGGGPIQVLKKFSSEEGVSGLWKEVEPAMAMAAVLTASQLATYIESKRVFDEMDFS